MISRRTFVKILSGVIAGFNISTEQVEDTTIEPVSKTTTFIPRKEGLEVLMGTQYYDADYYECQLIWIKDGRLYARKVVKFTRILFKLKVGNLKQELQELLNESISEFKKEVDFYLANNVPHPPTLSFDP